MKEAEAFRRAFTLAVLKRRAKNYQQEVADDPDAAAERFVDYQGDPEGFVFALSEEIDLDTAAGEVLEEIFPEWDGSAGTLVDGELFAREAAPIAKKLCAQAEVQAAALGYLDDEDEV